MYRTAIAPIVAVLALAVNALLGIEIGAEIQEQIVTSVATLVAVGVSLYGIFKTHDKQNEKKKK